MHRLSFHTPGATLKGRSPRKGFTLLELVVVVLVLGIVAAVAAPKMFNTAGDARKSGTEQSHQVVQQAIDMYYSRMGAYPGEAGTEEDFKDDLKDYLRGEFPKNQLSEAANDGTVLVVSDGVDLTAGGAADWKYDNTTGQFIINTAGFDGL